MDKIIVGFCFDMKYFCNNVIENEWFSSNIRLSSSSNMYHNVNQIRSKKDNPIMVLTTHKGWQMVEWQTIIQLR